MSPSSLSKFFLSLTLGMNQSPGFDTFGQLIGSIAALGGNVAKASLLSGGNLVCSCRQTLNLSTGREEEREFRT